jgi:hypothetical protein
MAHRFSIVSFITASDHCIRHDATMREKLSRTDDLHVLLKDLEYYELHLYDSDNPWRPGYVVQQSRATWSEIDRQVMFDEIETEILTTFERAAERYAARRFALARKVARAGAKLG